MKKRSKNQKKQTNFFLISYIMWPALQMKTYTFLFFFSLHINPDKTDIPLISHEYFTMGFGDIASITDRQDKILKTCFLSLKMIMTASGQQCSNKQRLLMLALNSGAVISKLLNSRTVIRWCKRSPAKKCETLFWPSQWTNLAPAALFKTIKAWCKQYTAGHLPWFSPTCSKKDENAIVL